MKQKRITNKTKISISALCTAAVLAATLIPLSVKYCAAVKTIEQKDEEIRLLKLKISNLTSEKEKLIEEKEQLTTELNNLTTLYNKLKENYEKTLGNFKSITNSILERNNNYETMLENYYKSLNNPEVNIDNEIEETVDFELELEKMRQVIKDKVSEYVRCIETKISELETNNSTIFTQNELSKYINRLKEIKDFGFNLSLENAEEIASGVKWISQSEKELNNVLSQINTLYASKIAELEEIITQKDEIIENSFNTAKNMVEQAINLTKNQIDYLETLKEIAYKFVNRDYSSYSTDAFANSMRNEAYSLINEINDYSNKALRTLDEAKSDYEKALKTKNIDDFSTINIESFPIKNKTFTKLIEALNNRDYEALFNKNLENWTNYNNEVAKYKQAMDENAELQAKIQAANNQIDTLNGELNTAKENITNLESSIQNNFNDTLIHTKELLSNLISSLEQESLDELNEVALNLHTQLDILNQLISESIDSENVSENQAKLYSAIDAIQNIIETYKNIRVLPLEAMVINLAQKISELNTEIDDLTNQLNTVNSELNSLSLENSENKERINELTLIKQTLEQNLSLKTAELETKTNEFKTEEANYQKQIAEKDLRIKDLERQLREQGGSNSQLEAEIESLKRDKSSLSSQVSSLNSQLRTVKSERDRLKSELASANSTIAQNKVKISELEAKIKKLEEDKNNPVEPTPPAPLPSPVNSNKSVIIGYDLLTEEYPKYTLTNEASTLINSWKSNETHSLETRLVPQWFKYNGTGATLGNIYTSDSGKVSNKFILRNGIKEKVRIPESAKSAKMKLLINGHQKEINLTKGSSGWMGSTTLGARSSANFDLNWTSITKTPNGSHAGGYGITFIDTYNKENKKWNWRIESQYLSFDIPFTFSSKTLEATNKWTMETKSVSKPSNYDTTITGDLDIFKGMNTITILEISWEE
ncbi:coiled-coil domain-containing protein [Mycoplasma anserisalpingitidis]|uniref:hypothetical protein n=1 Tax=Mycoplasma anserisalpingitidis TaxID=519450 RepID=UPI001CF64BB6|nr:hypothetical protein [Mycoplasma anserisalpingitidis]UCU26783.1 hypothetical protein K7D06_00425 [Mycoplasma anserisalpingitidis]UCU27622.1 hypothetical protein K9O38_01095 [Mycoplasma anserisalpingitidis]